MSVPWLLHGSVRICSRRVEPQWGCRKQTVTQALYAGGSTTQDAEMSSESTKSIVAAELADRYIEIVLSTKPELLMLHVTDADDASNAAENITRFRQNLINGLTQQPLPTPELDD
ncbi:hypothetical protein JC796_17485 [Delftia acidovorans]|uniref:hypothetical protein n=1 Tax=Delftia acidovorans TaxID=80866 RepID=UPI001A2B99F3|nr:hypothetical protein [Delftia acidovorans]MBJ2142539.1 hypothetical protein [Delftia acidovorans]